VVPVAGKGAVLDAAAIQRKAHMRAAIVEREDTIFVVDDRIGRCGPWMANRPFAFNSSRLTRAHEIGGRCVHERSSSAVAFAEALCSLSI
jgi:hypothetical protein